MTNGGAWKLSGSLAILTIGLLGAAPVLSQGVPPTLAPPRSPALADAEAPSSPAATDAIATVSKVCLPVLEGQNLKATATGAGFRQEHGAWVMRISGQRRIELAPPDAANPHVCTATIVAMPDAAEGLQQAIANWARAQTPQLTPVESNVTRDESGEAWTTSSWSAATAKGVESVVLTRQSPLDAAQGSSQLSQSELLVTITPA